MELLDNIKLNARKHNKRIVLPEGYEGALREFQAWRHAANQGHSICAQKAAQRFARDSQ